MHNELIFELLLDVFLRTLRKLTLLMLELMVDELFARGLIVRFVPLMVEFGRYLILLVQKDQRVMELIDVAHGLYLEVRSSAAFFSRDSHFLLYLL